MNGNNFWLFGGAAFLLTGVNLVRAFMGKRCGWTVLLFAALSCGALAVLEQYRMVNTWLARGDMAAIYDVVPGMTNVLTAALALGLVLNFLVLILNLWKNREKSA